MRHALWMDRYTFEFPRGSQGFNAWVGAQLGRDLVKFPPRFRVILQQELQAIQWRLDENMDVYHKFGLDQRAWWVVVENCILRCLILVDVDLLKEACK